MSEWLKKKKKSKSFKSENCTFQLLDRDKSVFNTSSEKYRAELWGWTERCMKMDLWRNGAIEEGSCKSN